jgi:hypothetical protein
VGVVAHGHRQAKAVGEVLAERNAVPLQVGRVAHGAVGVEHAGGGHADPQQRRRGRRHTGGDQIVDGGQGGLAGGGRRRLVADEDVASQVQDGRPERLVTEIHGDDVAGGVVDCEQCGGLSGRGLAGGSRFHHEAGADEIGDEGGHRSPGETGGPGDLGSAGRAPVGDRLQCREQVPASGVVAAAFAGVTGSGSRDGHEVADPRM